MANQVRITKDFETKSEIDLKKYGLWNYSVHPSTEVICLAYKIADRKTRLWFNPEIADRFNIEDDVYYSKRLDLEFEVLTEVPHDLFRAIEKGMIVEAHNAGFEKTIWNNIMVKKYGWPKIKDDNWMCSAAKAASYSLPRSLDGAGSALNLDIQKDKYGSSLINRLCKPKKIRPTKANPNPENTVVFDGSKKLFLDLGAYCVRDVDTEHLLSKKLPDLSEKEQKIWLLDRKINEKGIYCDLDMAVKINDMVVLEKNRLNKELKKLTGGELISASKRAAVLSWLRDNGIPDLENTQNDTIIDLVDSGEISDPMLLRILEIVQMVNKTSTKKFSVIADKIASNNRVKETLLYHGAGTGRWAGKDIQPQNLPRGSIKNMEKECSLIKNLDLDNLRFVYEEPMELFSSAVRGAICAPKGKELIVADYSAIEARGVLWLADDQRALNIFRQGRDIYLDMASRIFSRQITKEDIGQRQLGKQTVLGCGYGMGGSKFLMTCRKYHIDYDRETMIPLIPNYYELKEQIESNKGFYLTSGLTKEDIPDITISKFIVNSYRENYYKVPELWSICEEAAKKAVRQYLKGIPQKERNWISAGKVFYKVIGSFLFCRLPSGRMLCYPYPTLRNKETSWGEKKETIFFMGVDSVKKKWCQQNTYGGKLVENISQAVARDLMAEAMLRVDKSGIYEIVLTVHDELLTEVFKGCGSVEELTRIMTILPKWAVGFPLAAEGWRGERYRK